MSATDSTASPQTTYIGRAAPEFRLASAQGGEIGPQDFRGKNRVVLWFSKGLFCPFCRRNMAQLGLRYPEIQAMQAEAMLPEGQSLREVLAADYARVAERADSAGFELELLDRFAPWFVAVTLMQLELENHGFSAELGVEQTLTRRAVADHKPIAGLETAAQQFATFGRMPLPEQKRLLLMTLEETAELEAEVDKLLAAWRSGDIESLSKTLSEEYERFPELYGPLTENRNRAWVPQLVDLLDDDDDYLVVVGALHLVGRNSVIDLLEQRGYDVVQQ